MSHDCGAQKCAPINADAVLVTGPLTERNTIQKCRQLILLPQLEAVIQANVTYSLLVSVLRWARRRKFYALLALLNVGIPQIRRIGPAPTRCRATRYNYYRGLKSRVAFICRMTKCENLKIRANLRIHQT